MIGIIVYIIAHFVMAMIASLDPESLICNDFLTGMLYSMSIAFVSLLAGCNTKM